MRITINVPESGEVMRLVNRHREISMKHEKPIRGTKYLLEKAVKTGFDKHMCANLEAEIALLKKKIEEENP